MNLPPNPFQLKKHADDILEIIVDEPITPQHKAFAVLQAMAQKFQFIIFTLNEAASLHPALEPLFPEIKLLGSLLVVAADPLQIPFPLRGIRVFGDVHAARTRIRNDRQIEAVEISSGFGYHLRGRGTEDTVAELLRILADVYATVEAVEICIKLLKIV